MENKEVLLKVENLKQHFKVGRNTIKAIDGINFEIYKGEVFGLVGESGCGKSTTGRSIIRLYDITDGSIYFDGKRIAAGTQTYKENIKNAKISRKIKLKEINEKITKAVKTNTDVEKIKANCEIEIKQLNEETNKIIEENIASIKSARDDHKNCNKTFAEAEHAKVLKHYETLIQNEKDEEKKQDLISKMKHDLRVAKKERIMNKVQMIFQDPIASLNPRMTVRDIISEGLIIKGIKDQKYIDEQVFKLLELVGLVPEHANRYPHEFSGGQRQRIGIARAIIMNPELIIADEPISALDVSIQAQVINLLNELSAKMGLTTLFIAHDLAVVKYFSHRIAVMYYGKIVEIATADELFAHPLHPYTKSLLSAIPLPDPYFEKKRVRVSYNPIADHDYSTQQPTMREIKKGHFILCNDKEYEEYSKLYV